MAAYSLERSIIVIFLKSGLEGAKSYLCFLFCSSFIGSWIKLPTLTWQGFSTAAVISSFVVVESSEVVSFSELELVEERLYKILLIARINKSY